MSVWWQERTPRERLLLAAGVLALCLLLGYVGLWEPLQYKRETTAARVEQLRSELHWMRQIAMQWASVPSPPAATGTSTESLASLIDQSIRRAQLAHRVQRIEPRTQSDVQIVFEDVPFDDLIRWLGDLAQRYGIEVAQAMLDKSPQSGMVSARLVLRRNIGAGS